MTFDWGRVWSVTGFSPPFTDCVTNSMSERTFLNRGEGKEGCVPIRSSLGPVHILAYLDRGQNPAIQPWIPENGEILTTMWIWVPFILISTPNALKRIFCCVKKSTKLRCSKTLQNQLQKGYRSYFGVFCSVGQPIQVNGVAPENQKNMQKKNSKNVKLPCR